jgi:iron-sulfur cluster repair protein YtfE (RIC family)
MKNPLASSPRAEPPVPGTLPGLQARSLEQHDELRRLFRTAAVLAGAAARGDQACQAELPRLLDVLLGKLETHLAFEERTLIPLLAAGDASAQEHALALIDEHQEQRAELRRLLEQSRTSTSASAVAVTAALELFVKKLRPEFADEQRWLSEAVSRVSGRRP